MLPGGGQRDQTEACGGPVSLPLLWHYPLLAVLKEQSCLFSYRCDFSSYRMCSSLDLDQVWPCDVSSWQVANEAAALGSVSGFGMGAETKYETWNIK